MPYQTIPVVRDPADGSVGRLANDIEEALEVAREVSGYELIAVTPITNDGGGTTGVMLIGRFSRPNKP